MSKKRSRILAGARSEAWGRKNKLREKSKNGKETKDCS